MHVAVVGGSDAGIEAARRMRELDPGIDVTVLVADAYPNFSICGIPYYLSGEVGAWQNLAHRTVADLEATGARLLLGHQVTDLGVADRRLRYTATGDAGQGAGTGDGQGGGELAWDGLVLATGAHPRRPRIEGLDALGPADGVHVLHTMGQTFAVEKAVGEIGAGGRVVIVGAGYVGLEMTEAFTALGLEVTVVEQLAQVLPRTLDPALAAVVEEHLRSHGVSIRTATVVEAIEKGAGAGRSARLAVTLPDATIAADLVLVAAGVVPATELAVAAGIDLGAAGAVAVDHQMRTNLDGVRAAGDCVHTHHRLLADPTYLPLGTTAHKQGRVAGENAIGGRAAFAGSLGTQSVKLFERVAAATGLRDDEATAAGYDPVTVEMEADDHKRYYPGATPLHVRLTGDRATGRLLGGQLVGTYGAEVSKRLDVLAAAIFNGNQVADLGDLDLSYTPPLSSPWDPIQQAAHAWSAQYATPRRHA